jgi:pSer/pThr/pTyr-binding forkhead associated (FHA) protein
VAAAPEVGDEVSPEPRLVLAETGAVIPLPAGPVVVVGRAGDGGPRPDIDLGPFQAAEAGVSRAHIVLDLAGPCPCIKDLASTNGTYINGRRILPHMSVALGAGDQISLGQLALRIELNLPQR